MEQIPSKSTSFKSMSRRNNVPLKRFDGTPVKASALVFVAPPLDEPPTGGIYTDAPPWSVEENFQAAASFATAVLSCVKTNEGKYVISYLSDGFLNATGYSRREMYGETLKAMLPDDLPERIHDKFLVGSFPNTPDFWHYIVLFNLAPLPIPPEYPDKSKRYLGFFSYRRKDVDDLLVRIVPFFLDGNAPVWFDLNDINKGSNWRSRLEQGVVQSDRFVVFLTETYLDSEPCRFELETAIEHNKPILPVLMVPEDSEVVSKFSEMYPTLKNINWVNFVPGVNEASKVIPEIFDFLRADQLHYAAARQILEDAIAWKESDKKSEKLYRNGQSAKAAIWLNESDNHRFGVTPLTREFIYKSNRAARVQKTFPIAAFGASLLLFTASIGVALYSYGDRKQAYQELAESLVERDIQGIVSDSNYALLRGETNKCDALQGVIESLKEASKVRTQAFAMYREPDLAQRRFQKGIDQKFGYVVDNARVSVLGRGVPLPRSVEDEVGWLIEKADKSINLAKVNNTCVSE